MPLLILGPSAIALAVLAGALASGLDAAECLPLLAAAIVLQAGAAAFCAIARGARFRRGARERDEAAAAARRMAAAEAEAARNRLLATAAQEIRTPLLGVTGLLEAVLSAPVLPRGAREDAAAALQAARDLSLLLRDLAELPDGAAPPVAAEPFRVDEVMEDVVTLLAGRAAAAGARLTIAVATGTAAGWRGDPARLRQVLVNLVAHALQAAERGEVRIEARETAAGALELLVWATRLGPPAAPAAEGGVASLGISRSLALRMGGSIATQEGQGGGGAYTLTLPIGRAAAADLPAAAAASPAASPAGPPAEPPAGPRPAAARGRAVLVVDDVAVNRRLLGAVLQRAGYAHEEAEDAETALALVAARPFAAVLMDVEMPGVDGLEATRRLRALPGPAARLPVIAVTADGTRIAEAAARAAGVDAYLVKPVGAAELAALLADLGAPPAQP